MTILVDGINCGIFRWLVAVKIFSLLEQTLKATASYPPRVVLHVR